MTSNAQAQSLLSAERALHEESLDNHTARWQQVCQVLDMTTKRAEEEIEQERTNNVELANDVNDLCWQLQEAETELRQWDDWFYSGVFAPTIAPSSYYSSSSSQPCFVIQTFALCQLTCSLC